MTENKWFTIKKDGEWREYHVSNNLKYDMVPSTTEIYCKRIADAMNELWEQTKRFEKGNSRYLEENEKLMGENSMNELELFELWFDKQNKWVIKEKTSVDFGKRPFSEIKRSYEIDRDDVIMEEVILKMINQNEKKEYCDNECLAKNIVKKVRELEKDVC